MLETLMPRPLHLSCSYKLTFSAHHVAMLCWSCGEMGGVTWRAAIKLLAGGLGRFPAGGGGGGAPCGFSLTP